FETSQHPQRQWDLSLERQRRVATGKNQTKLIIRDFARVIIRLLDGRDQPGGGVRFNLFLESRPSADAVKCLMAGGLDDPGARELRDAGNRPLVHSSGKSFLRR